MPRNIFHCQTVAITTPTKSNALKEICEMNKHIIQWVHTQGKLCMEPILRTLEKLIRNFPQKEDRLQHKIFE